MNDPLDPKADLALWYVHNRRSDHAMRLIQDLIDHDYDYAYAIEGTMYQLGGDTVPVDLHRAAESFRKQAARLPCATCYLQLAHALLDLGGDARGEALTCIEAVAAHGNPPDTDLAFARFHHTAEPPDLRAAARHYRRAFFRGRTWGGRHLARLQWARRQYLRAMLVAAATWLAMPFFLVCVGKKSRNTFDGVS